MSLEDKLIELDKSIEKSQKHWDKEIKLRNERWEMEDRIREEKELRLDKQLKDTISVSKEIVNKIYIISEQSDKADKANKAIKPYNSRVNMALKWLCVTTILAYVILCIKIIIN